MIRRIEITSRQPAQCRRKPDVAQLVYNGRFAIVLWVRYARVICGPVLSLKTRDFVSQAPVTGCSGLRIVAFHLCLKTLNTLIVTQST